MKPWIEEKRQFDGVVGWKYIRVVKCVYRDFHPIVVLQILTLTPGVWMRALCRHPPSPRRAP